MHSSSFELGLIYPNLGIQWIYFCIWQFIFYNKRKQLGADKEQFTLLQR